MAAPIKPNTLTTMRLPLAPIAVWFLTRGTTEGIVIAAVLALLLEVTDVADGWLARKYNEVSDFGKLFDPFADAFSRYTLFMGVMAIGQASVWMLLAIFYRDSVIAFLRSIAATRGVVISARQSGKIKAVVQGVGTQVIFLSLVLTRVMPDAAWLNEVPWWTMMIITIVTLLSLVDYLYGNRSILKAAWNNEPAA